MRRAHSLGPRRARVRLQHPRGLNKTAIVAPSHRVIEGVDCLHSQNSYESVLLLLLMLLLLLLLFGRASRALETLKNWR